MNQLDSRELRYFVAVAEELHFGRAAERLGIAQPPLSRAIRQVERRLGVTLVERTTRRVALTPAGEVLLREGHKALDALAAAGNRARRAGRSSPALAVVLKPNCDAGLLPEILTTYRADPEAIPVDVLVCGIGEQAGVLRQGRADVAFLHHPYDDLSGFDTEDLLTLRQVAVLPPGHRLVGRAGVRVADLRDEPLPRWPGMTPDQASGPEVRDSGQLMQLVALGLAVAVMPETVSRTTTLPCVPVVDAEPITLSLGWPERSRSLALAAFVRAAAEVAARRQASGLAVAGQGPT
ncbi:LysR family transcriptional regulator [Goodfellowiella coeruleoviolacea]|uniref:DNA-binding transcriptional regulator, LysR family n=1 Tax=Goodfellowiella coeruleoviolacea TaxID=334858 RepID=A0AAE3GBH4_9PSEU|nr:LysR family transcriptional regulator [Goodfellowiella coeruleoviolacea]MCP2165242.1 DNA-binding transcriptional regulator, LysR family [Goodfellowiella coeruleoviolacea]